MPRQQIEQLRQFYVRELTSLTPSFIIHTLTIDFVLRHRNGNIDALEEFESDICDLVPELYLYMERDDDEQQLLNDGERQDISLLG